MTAEPTALKARKATIRTIILNMVKLRGRPGIDIID
jgi:hypothetical protein